MRLLFTGIALCIGLAAAAQSEDTAWVRENTWAFHNFDTSNVPWADFRSTFVGVAPSPAGDFDQIFYNQLYKNKL